MTGWSASSGLDETQDGEGSAVDPDASIWIARGLRGMMLPAHITWAISYPPDGSKSITNGHSDLGEGGERMSVKRS